jgi:glycine dehydrogenase
VLIKRSTEVAILSANYVARRLESHYPVLYAGRDGYVAHECILDTRPLKDASGIAAEDIAKRLMDFGVYAPTIYFPQIVPEAMMIEPTETESRETLDRFAEAFLQVREECRTNPDFVKAAPHNLPLRRVDEVKAAKDLILTHPFD